MYMKIPAMEVAGASARDVEAIERKRTSMATFVMNYRHRQHAKHACKRTTNGEEEEDEELARAILQPGHEVQDHVEEERGDELGGQINDRESELIGRGAEHSILALSDDDGTLRIGRRDLCQASERIIPDDPAG